MYYFHKFIGILYICLCEVLFNCVFKSAISLHFIKKCSLLKHVIVVYKKHIYYILSNRGFRVSFNDTRHGSIHHLAPYLKLPMYLKYHL